MVLRDKGEARLADPRVLVRRPLADRAHERRRRAGERRGAQLAAGPMRERAEDAPHPALGGSPRVRYSRQNASLSGRSGRRPSRANTSPRGKMQAARSASRTGAVVGSVDRGARWTSSDPERSACRRTTEVVAMRSRTAALPIPTTSRATRWRWRPRSLRSLAFLLTGAMQPARSRDHGRHRRGRPAGALRRELPRDDRAGRAVGVPVGHGRHRGRAPLTRPRPATACGRRDRRRRRLHASGPRRRHRRRARRARSSIATRRPPTRRRSPTATAPTRPRSRISRATARTSPRRSPAARTASASSAWPRRRRSSP